MIIELNMEEMTAVAGGNIVQEIEEAYPGGVWVGNSYFPNGVPTLPGFDLPPVY